MTLPKLTDFKTVFSKDFFSLPFQLYVVASSLLMQYFSIRLVNVSTVTPPTAANLLV